MYGRQLLLCFLFSLGLLAGCGSYDVTVNDRLVYTPKPLFSDYRIPDPALAGCVERAIADAKVSNAAQLRELACSGQSISSLSGLATFTGLSRLELSGNAITDLSPLSALTTLELLYLKDNRIVDPVPLYKLPALREVDLRGNADLLCPDQAALFIPESVRLPQHCRH